MRHPLTAKPNGNSAIAYSGDTLLLSIQAQPGASKTELAGIAGGRLKVRLAAAPEGGKANRELVAFMAALLRCPKKSIAIKSGKASRLKTLAIPRAYGEALETIIAR